MHALNQNELTYFRDLPESSPVSEVHLRVIPVTTPDEQSFRVKLICKKPTQKCVETDYSLSEAIGDTFPFPSDLDEQENTVTFKTSYLEELFAALNFLRERDIIELKEEDILHICAYAKAKSANRAVCAYHYENHEPPSGNWIERQFITPSTHFGRHQDLMAMYLEYRNDVKQLLARNGHSMRPVYTPEKPDRLLRPFTTSQHRELVEAVKKVALTLGHGKA